MYNGKIYYKGNKSRSTEYMLIWSLLCVSDFFASKTQHPQQQVVLLLTRRLNNTVFFKFKQYFSQIAVHCCEPSKRTCSEAGTKLQSKYRTNHSAIDSRSIHRKNLYNRILHKYSMTLLHRKADARHRYSKLSRQSGGALLAYAVGRWRGFVYAYWESY